MDLLKSLIDRFISLKLSTLIFVIFSMWGLNPVEVARSASSAESIGGGMGSYLFGQLAAPSSLLPSSSPPHQYQHHQDKALISAQFRAIPGNRDSYTLDKSPLPSASASVNLEDEEHYQNALTKYLGASDNSYSPSKMRLNRYSQTGFYNPYPNNVFPPTYYPQDYSYRDVGDSPPDNYPYYDKDRVRDYREKGLPSSLSYSSNRDGFGGHGGGYRSAENDYTAMSSGHGGGGGWGWGHHYSSKVNTNAIGLLGLLGLLSLLSNVLLQLTTTTTTTTAAARRKKRSDDANGETREEKQERIFMEVLPYLIPIANAKNGETPRECIFHGVCMTNKVLVNELGINGRVAGQRITTAVGKLFSQVGNSTNEYKKSNFNNVLQTTGLHGRNKKNCEELSPLCKHLPASALPFKIRMKDLATLISKVQIMTKGKMEGIPMDL